ncbi:MAG TPA: hypothetical protein VLH35_01355 [Candidatus Acidoferrales bacterium]|nr:hypothetical protein [Candidatus Acidoferrales bacterium]
MAELPIIKLGRKRYYYDARLKQLRNTKKPHDYIDLTEIEVTLLYSAFNDN